MQYDNSPSSDDDDDDDGRIKPLGIHFGLGNRRNFHPSSVVCNTVDFGWYDCDSLICLMADIIDSSSNSEDGSSQLFKFIGWNIVTRLCRSSHPDLFLGVSRHIHGCGPVG